MYLRFVAALVALAAGAAGAIESRDRGRPDRDA
jgi:hypothetical protein